MISVRNLELRLFEELGIPIPQSDLAQRPFGTAKRDSILRLRRLVVQLERDAAKIGAIPSGYPTRVTLVIRMISALLPWYTRGLVQFGNCMAQTARATLDVLDELAADQPDLDDEFGKSARAATARPQTIQERPHFGGP